MTELSKAERRLFMRIANYLLDELARGSHEVVLIPAPDPQHSGHKIRMIQSHNARWYREFADQFQSCRGKGAKRMKRPRTFIKRLYMEAALIRMTEGDFSGVYVERLLSFINLFRANRKHNRQAEREYREKTGAAYDYSGIPF